MELLITLLVSILAMWAILAGIWGFFYLASVTATATDLPRGLRILAALSIAPWVTFWAWTAIQIWGFMPKR